MPRESPTKEREKIIFPTNTEIKSSHQDEEDPLNNNKLFTVHAAASHPISQSIFTKVELFTMYGGYSRRKTPNTPPNTTNKMAVPHINFCKTTKINTKF